MSDLQNNLKADLFNTAGHILTSGMPNQLWIDAKAFVENLISSPLSGAEKHAKVKDQLQLLFKNDLSPILSQFGDTFIDTLIKTALMCVQAKIPQPDTTKT